VRREELEHLIRAAGAVTASRRIIVIGSQAILGQFPHNAPPRTTLSMEADLLPMSSRVAAHIDADFRTKGGDNG
jgi:hypothetical protein